MFWFQTTQNRSWVSNISTYKSLSAYKNSYYCWAWKVYIKGSISQVNRCFEKSFTYYSIFSFPIFWDQVRFCILVLIITKEMVLLLFIFITPFLLLLFHCHEIKKFNIWRQILLYMIRCKMAIDSVTITHAKHPKVFDLTKIFDLKECILVFLIRFVWNHSFCSLMSYFVYWVLKLNVDQLFTFFDWIFNIKNFLRLLCF